MAYTDRKPVDPPPIIELKVTSSADPGKYVQHSSMMRLCKANIVCRQFLQSPYLFMQCTLQVEQQSNSSESSTSQVAAGQEITGQSVSSLHRLKDINNEGERMRSIWTCDTSMANHLRNVRWRFLRVWGHFNPCAGKAQAQLQSVRAQKGYWRGCLPQVHHIRALQRGPGEAVAGSR